ncbi:MAG: cation-translocating P-type ATPase, partial [candidate division KSB1 bacterium]|nr:cation-translocating P-type ATPase [candidate division KSB1 bacterium]
MNHQTNAWHIQSVQEVLEHWRTDPFNGLSEAEANQRQKQYGPNELVEQGRKKPIVIFLEQFTSTLVIILMIAAVISGFLGKPTETAAILAIVFLFAFLSFIQEYRAEKALEALKKLSVPQVRVQRDGQIKEISARELVPGDIVFLEVGNLIPADLRLIESVNLQVQESILTGESESVEKETDALHVTNLPIGDRINLAFMGTQVTYGHGKGVVVATGMRTELGKIATLIQQVETVSTPLQRRLNQVGKLMAILGISVAILVMIIGLMGGGTLSEMFLTAVSVAVAVVPEGLPAVVTVTLALGAQRMLKRRALIRRLPAVETLGSVTVICSDKTGTLTENRMTVQVIDVAGHSIDLGQFIETNETDRSNRDEASICREKLFEGKPKSVCMVLLGGALCNDATLRPDPETGRVQFIGDPTEGALLVAASRVDINQTKLLNIMPRIAELPFDSTRKRMTTVHRIPSDGEELPDAIKFVRSNGLPLLSITKGAFDSLLDICNKVWVDDQEVPLDEHWRERIHQANQKMAEQGMRVLGFATKWLDQLPDKKELRSLEHDLTFIGLIGMVDPPRPEVKQAVQTCKQAGIRPIMITGDHPLTARFIANELGISNNGNVVTGQELSTMTDEQLSKIVKDTAIYARVSPEHKLRIVQALQHQGQIVAMTGDGVNDSPALKQADIGVAMGISGTDVSKQASDMILLDDNFATIVAAVEEGRVIYDNIRRFVKFSIAGNLGKVLVMLLMPLFGVTVALLPLQLLWLNLLTDGLLGLGLGLEPAEKNTMRRPPRNPKAHFFSEGLGFHVIWVGFLIGAIALLIGYLYFDPLHPENTTWQTMVFTALAFLQTGQALGSRSMNKESVISLDFRSNPTMWLMIFAVVGLQLAAIYLPAFNHFFSVKPLG